MPRLLLCVVLILFLDVTESAAQRPLVPIADSSTAWHGLPLLPQNFYKQHLSFFCKKESQLQKATGVNIYFRLGSKAYVDFLEKKPNAAFFDR